MSYLNYFFPYSKGTNNHEDHLTRAFLVLLKYSNSSLFYFYNYVQQQLRTKYQAHIDPLYESELSKISYQTQIKSLPEADTYVSVLITNEHLNIDQEIKPIQREAVYDGVISFNDEQVFFIETKPNKNNVWEKQLCPNEKDIPVDSGVKLVNRPAVLEWKEIINFLHRINESSISLPHEKLLINDFFDLMNTHFSYLNPYNDLSKCHTPYLANKRIEQILNKISVQPDKVKNHSGWGRYIELDFAEIKKIGLLLSYDSSGENWNGISIGAEFASTVSQARAFYTRMTSFDFAEKLSDWKIYNNFHLAFKNQNLVFLGSGVVKEYFEYYNDQYEIRNRIKQISKQQQLHTWLSDLDQKGFVDYGNAKQQEVNSKIMNKKYTTVNVCPAIYFEYRIEKSEAMELDKDGSLIPLIKSKMNEILSILQYPLNQVV
ncbi:MAG TPA: hypothetical protein VIN08_28435 [Ohtaekwangia sp.]|uniref:hypothetical protein n=1 Tax=Ohtaekwangia sp. TaxID=2066019 RepID=UPI002F94D657